MVSASSETTAEGVSEAQHANPAHAHAKHAHHEQHATHPHKVKISHRGSRTLWVLFGGIALWAYIGLVPLHLLHNGVLIYVWIVLGAAVVPATVLWAMAHRLL